MISLVILIVTSTASSEEPLIYRGNIIEIPLKPRKKMISLRLNEEDLLVIDKFVAKHGEYSRTLILTKLIEAFAEGLRRTGYCASSIWLVFTVEEGGEKREVSVVLSLKSRP